MSTDVSTRLAVRRRPLAELSAFPDLVSTYCTDYEAVADFYAGNPYRSSDRQEAAARAADYSRDRDRLADILLDQNASWGESEAARSQIEALRDPEAVAVVTGQQVGLFTGPLYTIYKTITTLQLADQLAEETGRPVVPIFWIEGEDHDFEEIACTHLLKRNDPVEVCYDDAGRVTNGNSGAVGRLQLGKEVHAAIDQLDDILPPSDFKEGVMKRVRSAYRPDATLEDAFARLLRSLFPEAGLVLMNPDDARLKDMTRPLFEWEIDDYEAPYEHIEAASEELRQDFHAQVHARPTNLFWLDEKGRFPIDARNGTFTLRHDGRTFKAEDLHEVMDESPERFSPNVVLRPLMQDMLLPTAAYVAGPSEVSYFAQYRGVYEWADVPMPIIYPRASVSLVESKVEKVLDTYDLDVTDFAGNIEQLFQRIVVDTMEVDVEGLFDDAMRHVHKCINTVKPEVKTVDRTLGPSVEATRTALIQEMEELKQRVVRAEKRNKDEIRAQLDKARVNLFPNGKAQERSISVLYFLNKYSLDFPAQLQQSLSLDTREHQVVSI